MIFAKTITADGQSLSVHALESAALSKDETSLDIFVLSWVDDAARIAGYAPARRSFIREAVGALSLSGGFLAGIAAAVSGDSRFSGATVLADASLGLAAAKTRRWAAIKAARQAAIEAPLQTPWGTFDADIEAQRNIANRVLMLNNLGAAVPQVLDYTLHDDSVVSLSPLQMVQVGLLLGAQVESAYARGRGCRTAIDAATQQSQLDEITWPAA